MREFVALMAALMAVNALAIDAMLPALPAIGEALGVLEDNRRQWVITAYLLGFGFTQILFGPAADRFGRKGLLIGSLVFYVLFAIAAGLAQSFGLLLAARMLQGMAAAGTRVLVVAIVRDRFHGSAMARVMSLVFIIFMLIPVLAPAFGQTVLQFASWRFIFIGLAVYGAGVLAWSLLRLPETLPVAARRPLSLASIADAIGTTFRIRRSIGNSIAMTLAFGSLFGFINSIQQIVFDTFARPDLIALVFACIAGPMALSSWFNSRLVERIGAAPLAIGALTAFSLMSAFHLAIVAAGAETLVVFVLLQAGTMALFGLIGANLGSLAMQPLGHVAGTGSAVQGLVTTVGGALIGLAIGQAYDGTTVPLVLGFLLCGLSALAVAAWANREG